MSKVSVTLHNCALTIGALVERNYFPLTCLNWIRPDGTIERTVVAMPGKDICLIIESEVDVR